VTLYQSRSCILGLLAGGVTKALDIGCGPGAVSFELARHFDSVLGIEIDADQLAAARTLQQHGELHYNSSNTTTTGNI
jgi:2-polyprenyl-3-methyl-5-hydroxy-6-metoxy-1,4-benzoquinol methylase